MPDPDFGGNDLPANKTTLAELIEDTGASTICYIYDFGDSWEHQLVIGLVTDPVPGDIYPRLTDIAGQCPPENVGGFPGYWAASPDTKSSLTPWPTPNTPNMSRSKNGTADPSTRKHYLLTNYASKSFV